MESNNSFQQRQSAYLAQVEMALEQRLPAASQLPTKLHDAMRYAVLGGGKRIRPLLVYASGEVLDIPAQQLDDAACAVELIHAYSLVHDDLPAMDDDDLRRHKPTVHKAYDEATGILVGDGLQALAFSVLAGSELSGIDTPLESIINSKGRIRALALLAHCSGSLGMVGGQAIDMDAPQRKNPLCAEEIEMMFQLKTGALLRAAILLPAYIEETVTPTAIQHLDQFARHIGLAFQIRDDILDIESETEVLGKTQGADIALGKSTYPAICGMDKAKQRAATLYQQAMEQLDYFGERAEPLRFMARYIVDRSY